MLEILKDEGITTTSVGRQDTAISTHIAILLLANNLDRNVVRGDNDMILFGPGLAGDSEFSPVGLGGDDEAVVVVPED